MAPYSPEWAEKICDVPASTLRRRLIVGSIFTGLGVDPLQKQLLLIKSTNHFHAGFAPIAREVLYARVEGPYPDDPRKTNYRKLVRRIWPRDEVFAV